MSRIPVQSSSHVSDPEHAEAREMGAIQTIASYAAIVHIFMVGHANTGVMASQITRIRPIRISPLARMRGADLQWRKGRAQLFAMSEQARRDSLRDTAVL